MHVITTTDALADACARLAEHPFVAVDTEFLRETTYWPKLCLVQAAAGDVEIIIDPLADGIDLAPFLTLMADERVLKVFHAPRQDLEIFHRLMGGALPRPVFDTQTAAMALGLGEQVAYDGLVQAMLRRSVDKTSRFTDWSRRPLSEAQLVYALGDVTHLRDLFPKMQAQLASKGRTDWVSEEMAAHVDPATYDTTPANAWKRLKPRRFSPDYLAAFFTACTWREWFAQERDVPRGRVLKDDAIYEIADLRPRDADAMDRMRAVPKGFGRSKGGVQLLEALNEALDDPDAFAPKTERAPPSPPGLGPIVELLKVLLRCEAERLGVAPRLLATIADLEAIAADDAADVPAMRGWRLTEFGSQALKLKSGQMGLALRGRRVRAVAMPPPEPKASPAPVEIVADEDGPEAAPAEKPAPRRRRTRVSSPGTVEGPVEGAVAAD
jgi:ribonuclease D